MLIYDTLCAKLPPGVEPGYDGIVIAFAPDAAATS